MTIPVLMAGDIGGTKTALALFRESAGGLEKIRDAVFPSHEHPTFEGVVDEFLHGDDDLSVRAGCFGVAGPVIEGRVQVTNLPWVIEECALAQHLKAQHVKLLNDLEAAAYGALFLGKDEICVLNAGASTQRHGNVAVIAAGTGLGEATG
jgi:glucokinase